MFSNGDKIVSRLNISQDTFTKLSDRQIKYINDILSHPPPSLSEGVRLMKYDKLKIELGSFGIPLHAAEYSYRSLEGFLRDVFPGWMLSPSDRARFLGAISRNAATQIVSIPLFVGIWKALTDGDEVEAVEHSDVAANHSCQIVEMRFVDTHFIFKLLTERLSSFLKRDVAFLRFEELRRAMTNAEIRLSENQYSLFQKCLIDSGVYIPHPENKVNRLVLIKVCEYFHDRSMETLSTDDASSVASNSMSSSLSRLARSLTPNWRDIKERLQQMNPRERGPSFMVSEDQLLSAVRDAGRMVISPKDVHELWCSIARQSGGLGSDASTLSLSEIETVIAPRESNYSSFSAIMRDEYQHAVVRPYSNNPNKEDHLNSIFRERPNTCTSSPPSLIPRNSVSSFPWQKDEADAVSNVKTRVLAGLRRAGVEKQRAFVHALYHNEKHYRNKVLPRGVLHEAFACADIHLNRHDVQDIWDEAHSTLPSPLRVVDLQQWLHLDHVEPPQLAPSPQSRSGTSTPTGRKSTSLADLSFDRHNRRYQAHYAPAWAPLSDESPVGGNGREPSRIGQGGDNTDAWSPRGQMTLEPDLASSSDAAYGETPQFQPSYMSVSEASEIILNNQAQLAYCFRTLSAGMGLVKAVDLISPLCSEPFYLALRDEDLWGMLCGMAGARADAPRASVYLRFNDAIRFLEGEIQKSTIPPADFRHRNIVDKLYRSKYVLGSGTAMLEQGSILRQRLRYSRQRGPVVSWDGVPDVCSPHEFMSLMNTIDISLSLDEVEFIYNNLRVQEKRDRGMYGDAHEEECMAYQIEHGFSLGAALKYLSDVLQSEGNQ